MRYFQIIVLNLHKVRIVEQKFGIMKKWLYVAEILLEVVKTILPYVKARQISIERNQHIEDADENTVE